MLTFWLTVLLPRAITTLLWDRSQEDGEGYLLKHRRRTGLIFSQWGDPQRGPHLRQSKAAWVKPCKPLGHTSPFPVSGLRFFQKSLPRVLT